MGTGKGEMGAGPLEVASNALDLLRAEVHSRSNNTIEKGGIRNCLKV